MRKSSTESGERGLVISPPISPEELVEEMDGCIKEGHPTIQPVRSQRTLGTDARTEANWKMISVDSNI